MATRNKTAKPKRDNEAKSKPALDSAAREELTRLIHGLSQLLLTVEHELWNGRYRNAANIGERKEVHDACESCLDALTTVVLLPPPPEVGERLLNRFVALMTADEVR